MCNQYIRDTVTLWNIIIYDLPTYIIFEKKKKFIFHCINDNDYILWIFSLLFIIKKKKFVKPVKQAHPISHVLNWYNFLHIAKYLFLKKKPLTNNFFCLWNEKYLEYILLFVYQFCLKFIEQKNCIPYNFFIIIFCI